MENINVNSVTTLVKLANKLSAELPIDNTNIDEWRKIKEQI